MDFIDLSSDRTALRKVQEAYLAIQIERAFTKEQIFTLYGNQIYLGSGNYGFEAASEYFFSKHARDLTLTQAALLAGLPKGPVAFSPLLYPERALRRRNLVISEMESDGKLLTPRPKPRATLRSACKWRAPSALSRHGFRMRFAKNWTIASAQKRCMKTVCASTPHLTSICKRSPITPL